MGNGRYLKIRFSSAVNAVKGCVYLFQLDTKVMNILRFLCNIIEGSNNTYSIWLDIL